MKLRVYGYKPVVSLSVVLRISMPRHHVLWAFTGVLTPVPDDDVVVRAEAGVSGRLRRCIPIGEYRERAYRVERDILDCWGDLSCKNGYLQRSAVLPTFRDSKRFMDWSARLHVNSIRP